MASLYDKSFSGSNERVNLSRGTMPSGVDPAQWESNPYASYDYRHSGWQKFLESLGFRTNYDKFKESMAINAAEYDAQLAEKAHNEEYDSPLEQNARLREAGINPDLAGETSSGSASPMEPDPNGPIEPGSDFDSFMNVGSLVMDGISMAFGLMQSGIGAMSSLQNLRGQKIDNDNKILDTAFKSLGFVLDPYSESNPYGSQEGTVPVNSYPMALSALFGSRRSKKYLSAVDQIASSLKGQSVEYGLLDERAGSKTRYIDKIVSPGYDEVSDAMKVARKWFQNDLWEEAKTSAKFRAKQASNKLRYETEFGSEDNRGPENQANYDIDMMGYELYGAEADVRNKRSEADLKEYRYGLRSSFDNLIQKMNQKADQGNNFAAFLSVVLGFLGVRMLGM